MADVRDLFYHGVRHQIRRVLEAMGPEKIEMGLTAFENGASNWSACFFARAYPELNLNYDPENVIAKALGMEGNRVPMRIVYRTFDSIGVSMTKQGLVEFIRNFLDEKRDPEAQAGIEELLRGVKYEGAEDEAVDFAKCAVLNESSWATRDWEPGK